MILEETKDEEKLKSILMDPKLYETMNGHVLLDKEDFKIDRSFDYHLIIKNAEVLGCFQTKEMTKLVREVHICLLPKHWGIGISLEAAKCGNEWLRENGYTQAWTKVPANAIHTIHFLNRIGYTSCGMIEKAMVFHNYLVSIFFFILDLNNTKI